MNKMGMRLMAGVAVLGLAGCASKPPKDELYAALRAPAQVATLAQAALTEPLAAVPGTRLAFELTTSDPIVAYKNFRTYYRPIRAQADAGGKLSFTLTALCTCFGFDKRVVIPLVAAFDASGAPLAISNARYEHVKASGGPYRIALSGTVRTTGEGEVRLLAMGDNELPDVVAYTTRMVNQYGHDMGETRVKSNPVGEFWFSVN